MLNSPMLSIFQHLQAIPLRSPLISLRSKWRLTGFSRRFTPKNPVRLHNPFGELPRWGAKNVLPLNLIALPGGEPFPWILYWFPFSENFSHFPPWRRRLLALSYLHIQQWMTSTQRTKKSWCRGIETFSFGQWSPDIGPGFLYVRKNSYFFF